ncbi:MAG: DNA helicase RecQ [Chitinophagales bacterium]|nr:DNA helicase RecQ [Chitinophagales bacterium]
MVNVEMSLTEGLKHYFGFENFKGNQEKVIRSILSGNDTFVIMPTGGGKSLCYQLPALLSEGTAVVISPLIALMKNQVDLVRSYSSIDNIAHFLNSSLNKQQIKQVKDDITEGKTKILYVAPESLVKEENIDFLKSIKISFVAVDEAHCISEWGHDFRPEYRRIRKMVDGIEDNIPIMALTATATPKVQSDIIKTMHMENPQVFISSFLRENLSYEIRPKQGKENTIKDIIRYIKTEGGRSGIIYCLSRKSTEEIAEVLTVNGINAAAYHAGLDGQVRTQRQDAFLMEELDVIVATIAFGMGIDKPDVRFVIHYDIPKSLENYYQETGRAGRDGLAGHCIAYFSYKDIEKLEKFMRDKPVAEREIGNQHLMEVEAYVESGECRKQFILHYFGEDLKDPCGNKCDNCSKPKEKREAKDDIILLLKAVDEINELGTITYVTNLLMGKRMKEILSFNHDKLSSFGKGAEKDELYWNSVIRKALLSNYLRKDIEQFGLLKINEEGRAFVKDPHEVIITMNQVYTGTDSDDDDIVTSNPKTNAMDPVLMEMLQSLRKSVAKKMNLPPFVIFQDPSLEDMATQYPITMEEMAKISGVSQGKAQRFGTAFIEMIAKYVEENDIDRPTDFVMKSVANKSAQKVFIIQNIDKKIPLEEIARSKGITFEDVLVEIESIVHSGTKVNLNYYINEVVDEEVQEIIYDYFMEAESDSIEDALKELKDDDVTMKEVRLMRIKFFSEVAN